MASSPLDPQNEEVDIVLSRGNAGLGFNIRGGVDLPHIKGNTGIFVTKIREKGAAAEDGRLREGDQIVQINNTDVLAVTHTTAVNLFLSSKESVTLRVIPREEQRIKRLQTLQEKQKLDGNLQGGRRLESIEGGGSSFWTISAVLIGLGAVAGGAFFAYKYTKQAS